MRGRISEKQQMGPSTLSFCNRTRKRHRAQLRVMAEVLRRRIREILSQGTSISLALDDPKYLKIVRFRVDLPRLVQRTGEGCSLWCHFRHTRLFKKTYLGLRGGPRGNRSGTTGFILDAVLHPAWLDCGTEKPTASGVQPRPQDARAEHCYMRSR